MFDLKSQGEMKPLMDNNYIKNDSVSCMDIVEGSGFLLCGYKNGSIALWDLNNYKLLKHIPELHDTDVTNVKIYDIQNNGG